MTTVTHEAREAGGPRSVSAKVARRHTREYVIEYENEQDDEDDFQRRR